MNAENDAYQKLIEYALRIISRKNYTESEIRKKLDSFSKRRSLDLEKEQDKVMDRLRELNYLNDSQFIRNYTNDRINFAPRAKRLIKLELLKRGVDREIVEKELNAIDIDEERLVKELTEKYMRRLKQKVDAQSLKRRLFGFLARKGFGPDAIYKALSDCYNLGS